jgi:predicted adenylyl cyclase CyaB
MKEIEVKILEIDVPRTLGKLEQIGAEKVDEGIISALFFESKKNPLGKGKVLRLRRHFNEYELCYKEKLKEEGVKSNEEVEVTVSDFRTARILLEKLGFSVYDKIEKRRVSYKITKTIGKQLYDVKFEFDTILGIPTYLEIEATRSDLVKQYVERLGYKMKDTVDWNQIKVVDFYKNKGMTYSG